MRKLYLLLFFCLGITSNILAQGFINSLAISPLAPGPTDTVIVTADIFTSYSSCGIANQMVVMNGNTIELDVCYWHGMLAALCPRGDQFTIGVLPPGSYTIDFTMFTSSDQNCINPMLAANQSINFVVAGTYVQEIDNDPFAIQNISGGHVLFTNKNYSGELEIIDASGRTIVIQKVIPQEQILFSNSILDNGFYVVLFHSKEYKHTFAKSMVIY